MTSETLLAAIAQHGFQFDLAGKLRRGVAIWRTPVLRSSVDSRRVREITYLHAYTTGLSDELLFSSGTAFEALTGPAAGVQLWGLTTQHQSLDLALRQLTFDGAQRRQAGDHPLRDDDVMCHVPGDWAAPDRRMINHTFQMASSGIDLNIPGLISWERCHRR